MKTIKIIARSRIINPNAGEIHCDEDLRALNCYYEDVIEVDENYDKVSLVIQYEELYPEIKGWDFQIIELDL